VEEEEEEEEEEEAEGGWPWGGARAMRRSEVEEGENEFLVSSHPGLKFAT
jgi:hypothetical protein